MSVAMDREKLKGYAEKINDFYSRRKRMPSYSEMLTLFSLRSGPIS